MKTIVLNQNRTIDGVQRVKGEYINVPDNFSDKFVKKVLKRFETQEEKRIKDKRKKFKLEKENNGKGK